MVTIYYVKLDCYRRPVKLTQWSAQEEDAAVGADYDSVDKSYIAFSNDSYRDAKDQLGKYISNKAEELAKLAHEFLKVEPENKRSGVEYTAVYSLEDDKLSFYEREVDDVESRLQFEGFSDEIDYKNEIVSYSYKDARTAKNTLCTKLIEYSNKFTIAGIKLWQDVYNESKLN